MTRRIVKGLFFSGFWIYGAIGGNAATQTPPVTITLQSDSPSVSSTGTGYAYYVVNLSRRFPSPSLTMSYLSGMPTGASQQLTGAAPCSGGVTTLCTGSFTLTPGSSCCLAFTLTGSQMSLGANTLQPTIGTRSTTTPSYSYYPTAATVQVSTAPTASYTGIYAETNNSLVTYSPDNGTTWGYMLSPQGGWYWDQSTWATAVTTDGTLYQATGVQGSGTTGNGAATLIYSSDGVTWNQVNSFPTDSDWVQSLFAVGNTVYVGTGNGYVYYTSNQGTSWLPNTPAQVSDAGTVNAVVVDANNIVYAGTSNGTIYSSTDFGQNWIALTNQPGGSSISSLAVDTNGTLYAVTSSTTTQPQYNTAPTTGAWQSMTALPGSDGNATTIAASGTTVFVGTDSSYILHTSSPTGSWTGSALPSGDTSGIKSLSVNQTNSLSPLFVESYGAIPINSGASDCNASGAQCTITVQNLTTTTATNVQADSSQLPTGVTQASSSGCASVASEASCTLTFSATSGFAPTAFNIIDSSNNTISRSALVSSITPNSGTNYYYVYNVSGSTAYTVDNSNVSNNLIWGSDSSGNVDYTSIWGIAENSTTSSPYPNTTQPAGQTATKYSGQANCNGATDGSCDSTNIYIYYNNVITNAPINTSYYAEGACYASTAGGAGGTGQWYLPAACELNGGVYLDVTTNNFVSCSPVPTGILSLYNLGNLSGVLSILISTGVYWSSTEYSVLPQGIAWNQYFASGGGSYQGPSNKALPLGVRCSRALTL